MRFVARQLGLEVGMSSDFELSPLPSRVLYSCLMASSVFDVMEIQNWALSNH